MSADRSIEQSKGDRVTNGGASVDSILDAAAVRTLPIPAELTIVQPSDSELVACARLLVAALRDIERANPEAAVDELAQAEALAKKHDVDLPGRLRWFLDYLRGDVAIANGDPEASLVHLDASIATAAEHGLRVEWLRSSANALIVLRARGHSAEVTRRLHTMFEWRGRTSSDSLFYQVVADTLNWLGRPQTAIRVRRVGMGRRRESDEWWHRNLREMARFHIAVGRVAEARVLFEEAARLEFTVEAQERLVAREVEAMLLLAEWDQAGLLRLVEGVEQLELAPRLAVTSARAAVDLGDAERAGELLQAIDGPGLDVRLRMDWLEVEAARLALVGDAEGAATRQREALEWAAVSQPPLDELQALVAHVEAWLAGEPTTSLQSRIEATEGGLSDLRSTVGSLMLLCDLREVPDAVVTAKAAVTEIELMIEAMSLGAESPEVSTIDLHELGEAVIRAMKPVARRSGLAITNNVPEQAVGRGPYELLSLALQGMCVVICAELRPGQQVVLDAESDPLRWSITVPDADEAQCRELIDWFGTTVARGHHEPGTRRRLSILGVVLAKLWNEDLFTSVSPIGNGIRFRIESEGVDG